MSLALDLHHLLLPCPPMTTTSSAYISNKLYRRSDRNSSSGFTEEQRYEKATKYNVPKLDDRNPNEEANKLSNESIITKDQVIVRYKECKKNHAAKIGGYAVDGCCEFMPAGEEGTTSAFSCAACGCHRNFHRREIENEYYCDCSSMSI